MRGTDHTPDLEFGPLRVWIHGYEFPDAKGFWDANWVILSANISTSLSHIQIHKQACWHLMELHGFLEQLRMMRAAEQHTRWNASMETMENMLNIEIEWLEEKTLELSSANATESHNFFAPINLDGLDEFILQLEVLCRRYPMKHKEQP